MNRQQQDVLQKPTPLATACVSNLYLLRPHAQTPERPRALTQNRPIEDDTLARIARESFEAGFAAGAGASAAGAASSAAGAASSAAGAANALQTEGRPQPAEQPPAPKKHPARATSSLHALVTALTPRRFEVLQLVARGLTNPEIATVLGISANTVKAHLTGILETLELTNRTEAAIALQDYEAEHRS